MVYDVRYTNEGDAPGVIEAWTNNHYALAAKPAARAPAFWSYQAGSYEKPAGLGAAAAAGFKQDNFLGMNATDYGGGTPVVDVWRRDLGLAVGHLERTPRLVSLPVAMRDRSAARSVGGRARGAPPAAPGESFDTLRTFVAVHRGDHFQAPRRLPPPDGGAGGACCPTGAALRLRADLVRLGLRPRVHPRAGGGHAAHGRAAGLRAGRRSTTAGRRPRATGCR